MRLILICDVQIKQLFFKMVFLSVINILVVSMDFNPLELPKLTALMNVTLNIPQVLQTFFKTPIIYNNNLVKENLKMREVD